ncbi:MAG: hypothetical protein CSB06_01715 [Bacteroidia bacterium]|nr:MAG: hypothetical protein CSB06_01715 [Bacteroidia bacterium]
MNVSRREYNKASYSTVPTKRTMFWRRFIPWQAWRFIVLNLKIIKIVA